MAKVIYNNRLDSKLTEKCTPLDLDFYYSSICENKVLSTTPCKLSNKFYNSDEGLS